MSNDIKLAIYVSKQDLGYQTHLDKPRSVYFLLQFLGACSMYPRSRSIQEGGIIY